MKFHPAVLILAWCMLVAAMQVLAPSTLLFATTVVLLCVLLLSRRKFVQLVRRTRWVMLSLLLIYAYSTPGIPLLDEFGVLAPSREGLVDGALQLARLLDALAGLAILLDRLHRQQLIAGLYTLFIPLQWLGLSRARVAVRLALTLQYAEAAMLRGKGSWQDSLNSMFEPHPVATRQMELPLYRFGINDALLLGMAMLLLLEALS